MIQLATDPTASRMSYRPTRSEDVAKEPALNAHRGRTGHAWPFLSRYAVPPARQEARQSNGSERGS